MLFVLSDAHLYDAYVRDRGWSPAQLARWLGDAFCSLLLPLNATESHGPPRLTDYLHETNT